MKRSVAILLMVVLCVGGFFGLSALKQEDTGVDVAMQAMGIPGDSAIATVNGVPISVREYGFWIAFTADTLSYYSGGIELDWEMEEDGFTLRNAIENEAMTSAKLYALVESKAQELGLTLGQEEISARDALIEKTRQEMGGQEGLMEWLDYNGLSYEEFVRQTSVPFYYDVLTAALGDSSPATTAEVEQYITEHDIMRTKHILFMTIDPTTYQPLEESVVAEKKALAESVLAQLQASTDLEADFDRLMQEHSEDGGLAANPDGYTFTGSDNFVAAFKDGTRALEYGQISGVVESEWGYHILLRLDPATAELAAAVVENRIVTQLNQQVSDWMAETELETTEIYDSFDAKVYYDALTELRAQQEAAE